MKPRKNTASRGRSFAVVMAAAGLIAIGTVVSNSVVSAPELEPGTVVAVAERPSYLSQLPELTEEALQTGVIKPARVSASKASPARVTTVAALTVAPAPESKPAEPESEPPEPEPVIDLFRVTANGLNVRSGPSSDSGKLFVLKQDEAVEVAEVEGNWARIVTASGESGWAFQRYLAPAAE